MEYITSNKGGRKLAFENNIYIKQKVLSNGTVWGDIMGDFVWGILSGGFCPGRFCPRTILIDMVCPNEMNKEKKLKQKKLGNINSYAMKYANEEKMIL